MIYIYIVTDNGHAEYKPSLHRYNPFVTKVWTNNHIQYAMVNSKQMLDEYVQA